MTDNSEVVELFGFYHSKGVPVPVWVDFAEEIYGLPDFKGAASRSLRTAMDRPWTQTPSNASSTPSPWPASASTWAGASPR